MMTIANSRLSLALGLLVATGKVGLAATPVEKPQTMDEMWKIIQVQQQQIDSMTKKLESVAQQGGAGGNVSNLERKTNVLTEEVEKLRTELVVPEKVEYKSAYGLGPAASKVYSVGKGLSIGGYGEANYQARVEDQEGLTTNGNVKTPSNPDNTDVERLVIYTGYKFSDSILFNSEIEFEHASTGNNGSGLSGADTGTVSVEMAALDFFINPMLNVRAGMLLMPMGFINQIHEPPFFFGNNRPEVERRIIPSTWRENGVGLFGELLPGLTYTTYVVNGMNARNFSASGIRSGRQSGGQALAEDLAYVGRLDYTPPMLPSVTVGGSAYVGNSGQNQLFNNQQLDVATQLYEAHVQWKYRGLEFRTLGSWGHIGDAALLSAAKGATIGEENYGWYSEVGYDILPHFLHDTTQYLAPFVRYERMDTVARVPTGRIDDLARDVQIYQVGLNYKPIPNVVIKADYRNFTQKSGVSPDDFNLGVGFIF